MNVPALDEFPLSTWSRLGAEAWREADRSWLGSQPPGSHAPLREVVAKHLREVSGLACGAEQIVVTAGSQQALGLVARVLLGPGDAVWVEEPGDYAAPRGARSPTRAPSSAPCQSTPRAFRSKPDAPPPPPRGSPT